MRRSLSRGLVATSLLIAAGVVPGVALGGGAVASPAPTSTPASSTVGRFADFDTDGRGDVAIGSPGDAVGGAGQAGTVSVLYGAAGGLSATGSQLWSQDSPGILGVAELGDSFGQVVAVGDFNGDGFTDLAVGVPREGVGAVQLAGAVNIIYGSAEGLTATGNQLWDQNSAGLGDVATKKDFFGAALAVGDFNEDGYADLAVGVPGERVHKKGTAGQVDVLDGSPTGLTAAGSQLIPGTAHGGQLGAALAAGNFDGSGATDLAAAAPTADNGAEDAGQVVWMQGTASGLGAPHVLLNTVSEAFDQCGWSLAALNRDNDPDGYSDLAVGCPFVAVDGTFEAGVVDLHFGSASGLGDGTRRFHGPDPQVSGYFGWSLAAADFGKDSGGFSDDIAVGEPDRTVNGVQFAGRVVLFYVTSQTTVAYQVVRPGLNGTIGTTQPDQFGLTLSTGNFDGDGWGDLVVGAPNEDIDSLQAAGGVNVLYGSTNGITSADNQFWSKASSGVVGSPQALAMFGLGLSGRVE